MKSQGRRRKETGPILAARMTSRLRTSGYTLLEMLLVLSILGALVAFAWPSVLQLQANHDLSAAAEQVRLQLGSARSRAIHAGLAFQFRYEPDGRHYAVTPFEGEPETTKADDGARHRFAGEVSQRITFVTPKTPVATTAQSQKMTEEAFRGLPDAGELAGVGWSAPLIFSPDGSAADAVVTVGDARGYRLDVTVRGLTGAAETSLMRRESVR